MNFFTYGCESDLILLRSSSCTVTVVLITVSKYISARLRKNSQPYPCYFCKDLIPKDAFFYIFHTVCHGTGLNSHPF